jgi:deferrochelatase/peroxidase EfeB
MGGLSRRHFLGAAAGTAAVGAFGLGAAVAARPGTAPFDGPRQSGIDTPARRRSTFAAFDVRPDGAERLPQVLAAWTAAARALVAGQPVGTTVEGDPAAPPQDTGEAMGLGAAGLTLTLGIGPSLFGLGVPRARPAALIDLPAFAGDALNPARCGGDLCLLASADDEQVVLHAVRNLARLGAGVVAVRYLQSGAIGTGPGTPRNLLGFKDGTANQDPAEVAWIRPGDGPDWMVGGSYLITRRIRLTIETWDRTSLREQELVFGRTKGSGAPLSGGSESTAPDLAGPAIDANAHVRLAHPQTNGGARMVRRGFNYADGLDPTGRLDAGLFFLAYQRDPRTAFVPVQHRLAASDLLNEYIRHVGSGVWAVLPGPAGGSWGDALFG